VCILGARCTFEIFIARFIDGSLRETSMQGFSSGCNFDRSGIVADCVIAILKIFIDRKEQPLVATETGELKIVCLLRTICRGVPEARSTERRPIPA
jgi:hypothetical protein